MFVSPVRRHRVLGQVVGADREEVDLQREHLRHQGRSGDLNHHADLHAVRRPHAPRRQRLPGLSDHAPRATQFVERRHHREHDLEGELGRHAQGRPQLRGQECGFLQTETDAPHPQERIGL